MAERKAGQPYTWEEVLSFDRVKRAMKGKALDRIEAIWRENQPISPEQIKEVINDEWQKVKEAVRSSPAAREAFRKYLERTISEQIDELVQRDRAELESLGVVEKSL
jgi:serine protease inhibitor